MFCNPQISDYSLYVHMSDTGNVYMSLWKGLTLTGRGGNEMASALLAVLNTRYFPVKIKLTIWSDNCIGQNKNQIYHLIIVMFN